MSIIYGTNGQVTINGKAINSLGWSAETEPQITPELAAQFVAIPASITFSITWVAIPHSHIMARKIRKLARKMRQHLNN